MNAELRYLLEQKLDEFLEYIVEEEAYEKLAIYWPSNGVKLLADAAEAVFNTIMDTQYFLKDEGYWEEKND